jgi:tRNA-2-methylthio-N6-dimethylallyladenosine synthase
MNDLKDKDFSKYFEGPNLKDARKRGREEVKVLKDSYEIPGDMKTVGKGKKYYVRTYGCQMNERDTEFLKAIFEEMGYEESDTAETSDVIMLNTCAIRENAENKVFGILGSWKKLKRENPELIFGVSGCMSQEEEVVNKILSTHQHIDMIFGTHNIHRLPFILRNAMLNKEMVVEVWSKEGDIIENLPSKREENHKAWVNVIYGCDKFCTYCIVPYTRGKERSRQPEDILNEIRELADRGFKEVTLLGQNVNAYGKDFKDGYSMADLLRDVQKIDIPRVRFTTSHPWDFTDEMVEVLSTGGNLMPFIHLPVQSGNSDILKIMGRTYSRDKYMDLFNKLKKALPHASFTTDIIVGFPNETNEQFEDTLSLVEECKFDGAYTFIYSPREGTPAARMEDNVTLVEKKERLQRLNARINHYALENNMNYKGKTVKVLVDGTSKKNDEVLSGYTETNKLINFKGDKSLIGKIVEVEVIEAKTWTLTGELISE